jgi:hypothetical protein
MTEAEWMACTQPQPALDILTGQASVRKWRLFAVESCRRVLRDFYYPDLEAAVEFGSTIAEGFDTTDWSKYDQIREDVEWGMGEMCETLNRLAEAVEVTIQPHILSADSGRRVVESILSAYQTDARGSEGDKESSRQAGFLREIFGNPFRPVTFSPAWRTDTAVTLARQVYKSRDFSAMPILADALQDTGCGDEDILSHCRGDGPHVRGCWVVDLVLGKE